jgi:nitroimidazol reductase NimA-like FMN-containing flavoprotein (pyridoxamine 5'-phosphate oxidase superfamily)
MENEQTKQIATYIGKCSVCTIATASLDGEPSASTVYFSNNGLDIYFNTSKDSQKVRNITYNPKVAIALQDISNIKSDRDIKGVQYSGNAAVLSEGEIAGVPSAVRNRHRAFNSVNRGNSVIVKVSPVTIHFIDYSRGFRYRDVLQFK